MAQRTIRTSESWIRTHCLQLCLGLAIIGAVIVYALLFIVPVPVLFSYGEARTCLARPMLLPSLNKTADDSHYKIIGEGEFTIAGAPIFAAKTCIVPTTTPIVGTAALATAPLGGWMYRQQLTVNTPESPNVSTASLNKPVSTTKPLRLNLAQPDVINTYSVRVEGKTAQCKASNGMAVVLCDIPSLDLDQGRKYTIEVYRAFKTSRWERILTTSMETLTATTIVDGSVKNDETVYARPVELTFTTDKPLKSAKAALSQEGASTLASTTTVSDRTVTVKLEKELPREAVFTLAISQLEAQDGSSLADPYAITFKTSGGPKVTGVSIGKAGVAVGARIVVSFDQELSATQDITKLATISGGLAAIARSGNQIIYTLQGMGLCAPFTLSIAKGLESKYDIASTNAWSYTSRTICHTTSVYGYSVKGRPLVAYHFGGSGATTLYVGAIHGNEPSSSGLMKAWIDDLEANPSLYNGKRIVVVPTINPDGVAANTRTNARGVNLNRNFPTDGWTKDIKDTDGNHPGGGGETPLSEPEARAIANLTISLRPRLLLSFHAVGSLVIGDPGGYSAGYAAKYASMVGYRNATGQSGTFDYSITGAYEDWSYVKQGVPSMVIELGSYGYFNFAHHRAALRAMLD